MGPYLDFFVGFGLRMKELRVGHSRMPLTKKEGNLLEFPVAKYGLNGAHHVLLEGCTFPPEKRSSMAQRVGPMTAFLCMVKSEGIYRAKWAAAVKRAFNHIPIIDDIIEITKTQRRASDINTMISLLAEIILITTSRQATRMFFPIGMLRSAWRNTGSKDDFLSFFNTSGSGGYLTYKEACKAQYTMSGTMTEEDAGQIAFHSIFGTFKEDLGILGQITNMAYWKTREELGSGFKKIPNKTCMVRVKMPVLLYYSKMSSANQSGLLSSVYTQVSSVPVFSGVRKQIFGADFFEHIQKRSSAMTAGKTIPQINGALSSILEELHEKLKKNKGTLDMGTVGWKSMDDLALGTPGSDVNVIVNATGRYFMGKPQ